MNFIQLEPPVGAAICNILTDLMMLRPMDLWYLDMNYSSFNLNT